MAMRFFIVPVQLRFVDAIEHVGTPGVELRPLAEQRLRVDALGTRQAERRTGARRISGRRHGEDAAERLAVVANVHRAVALVALEDNA
ncbi:MAG: hypothetical protein M3Y55_17705, partial [Pseudomonadota bacterium]|nr:hypothetical protein [Pseudomonadota bacterium]